MIPIEFLHECLTYNRKTGELRWKRRPRSHFKALDRWAAWNSTWAFKRAGSPHSEGYRTVAITCNGRTSVILEHRVAWALATGAWPVNVIDHRDLNRSNNRFRNLRDITFAENCQNTTRPTGVSKLRGAYRSPRGCLLPWRSQIKANGILHLLGQFKTAKQANAAYLKAKAKLHIQELSL